MRTLWQRACMRAARAAPPPPPPRDLPARLAGVQVLVVRLVTAGTIEERVVGVAADKRAIADRCVCVWGGGG